MDSLDRQQKRAIVNKNVSVKSSTNFISRTVDRIEKGEAVIVVSSENGYSKIRSIKEIWRIGGRKIKNTGKCEKEIKKTAGSVEFYIKRYEWI